MSRETSSERMESDDSAKDGSKEVQVSQSVGRLRANVDWVLINAVKTQPYLGILDEVKVHGQPDPGLAKICELKFSSLSSFNSFGGFVPFFYGSGLAAAGGVVVKPPFQWNGVEQSDENWKKLESISVDEFLVAAFTPHPENPDAFSLAHSVNKLQSNLNNFWMGSLKEKEPFSPHQTDDIICNLITTSEGRVVSGIQKSLFQQVSNGWNFSDLRTDVQDPAVIWEMDKDQKVLLQRPGLAKPELWFGEPGSVLPLQKKPGNFGSVVFNHMGEPMCFIVVASMHARKLEEKMGELYPGKVSACKGFLRHEELFVGPLTLKKLEIPFVKVVLDPNSFLVLAAGTYYEGFATGTVLLETVAYGTYETFLHTVTDNYYCNCDPHQVFVPKLGVLQKYDRNMAERFLENDLKLFLPGHENQGVFKVKTDYIRRREIEKMKQDVGRTPAAPRKRQPSTKDEKPSSTGKETLEPPKKKVKSSSIRAWLISGKKTIEDKKREPELVSLSPQGSRKESSVCDDSDDGQDFKNYNKFLERVSQKSKSSQERKPGDSTSSAPPKKKLTLTKPAVTSTVTSEGIAEGPSMENLPFIVAKEKAEERPKVTPESAEAPLASTNLPRLEKESEEWKRSMLAKLKQLDTKGQVLAAKKTSVVDEANGNRYTGHRLTFEKRPPKVTTNPPKQTVENVFLDSNADKDTDFDPDGEDEVDPVNVDWE